MNFRNLNIDILRGISILVVVFYHYRPSEFFSFGLYGVMLFFMISGFCISASLEKTPRFLKFILDRWRRLVPALIACALITTIIEKTFPYARPDRLHGWQEFTSSVACMPTLYLPCKILEKIGHPISRSFVDGAYWSLVFEFQFYFYLAALYFLISKKYFAEIFSISTLVLVVLSCLEIKGIPEVTLYFPQFLVGIAFYKYSKAQTNSSLICVAASAASMISIFIFDRNPSSMPLTQSIAIISFFSCSILLGVGVLTDLKWKRFVPIRQVFVLYGIISYPLYLLHQDIGYVIMELDSFLSTKIARALIVPTILTVIAYLVHRFIEYSAQPKKRPNWRLEW